MKLRYIMNALLLLSAVSFRPVLVNDYTYWKEWLIDQEENYKDLVESPIVAAEHFLTALSGQQFYIGVSTSDYQHGGGYANVLDKNGRPADAIERYAQEHGLPTPGHAVDLYDNYEEDIPKIKQELGVNSMRISIGWSRVEPDEGNFNQQAIDRYIGMMKMLQDYGIEPIVCFHHYTNPQWFMDQGDFVKSENNPYFVRFCGTVGRSLIKQHVEFFLPVNGIQSYGLRAYFSGDQIPKEKNLQKAMEVTANILDAHVDVYHELKKIYAEERLSDPTIPEPQVGLFVVYHPLNPVEQKVDSVEQTLMQKLERFLTRWVTRLICWMGNKIQNPGVFSFFKTGKFDITLPIIKIQNPGLFSYFKTGRLDINLPIAKSKYYANVHRKNVRAPGTVDFVVLSAYSDRPMVKDKEYMDDISEKQKTGSKNYYACPQIVYRATKYAYDEFVEPMKKLYGKDIPIMIAENGISTQDEAQREWYYKQVMISLIRAVNDGYPLIGYLPWTATDCFEWRSGRTHTYGLINVAFEDEPGNNNGRPVIGFVKAGAKFWADFTKNVVRGMRNNT